MHLLCQTSDPFVSKKFRGPQSRKYLYRRINLVYSDRTLTRMNRLSNRYIHTGTQGCNSCAGRYWGQSTQRTWASYDERSGCIAHSPTTQQGLSLHSGLFHCFGRITKQPLWSRVSEEEFQRKLTENWSWCVCPKNVLAIT